MVYPKKFLLLQNNYWLLWDPEGTWDRVQHGSWPDVLTSVKSAKMLSRENQK